MHSQSPSVSLPMSLTSIRLELTFHEQETARLREIIANYEEHTTGSPGDTGTRGSPGGSPFTTSVVSDSTLPRSTSSASSTSSGSSPPNSTQSRHRFLDEEWAVASAAQTVTELPWMQQWSLPYARPPVLLGDPHRSTVAQRYASSAVPAEEILTRLCQLARAVFRVKWAAVAIVEENLVHLKASDTVHPPMIGKTVVPRCLSLCNWVLAKQGTLVIPDMEVDPAMAENPVCKDFGCRFYAASPLVTSDGVYLGTFCVMDPDSNDHFDESAQAILEVMASTVMSQLEVADMKRKREHLHHHLLSNVSHELRTPIHGILGVCELLSAQSSTTSPAEHVNEIRQEAHSMISLVNDMLDHIKLDAELLSLAPADFCLHSLLAELSDTVGPAASEARVQVQLFHPYTAEHLCHGDSLRLKQILLHLVGNAVKFSHSEHRVEVRLRHLERMPETLLPSNAHFFYHSPTTPLTSSFPDSSTFFLYVQVIDTGCGISAARLSKIFDSFSHNEERNLARLSDGAGLGLGLCKRLTELIGGMMLVESKEGLGSVFHVVLPLQWRSENSELRSALALWEPPPTKPLKVSGEMTPRSSLSRRLTNFNVSRIHPRSHSAPVDDLTLPTSHGSGSGLPTPSLPSISPADSAPPPPPLTSNESKLILVVDDNRINQKVAIRFLTSHGYSCVSALNGYQALDVLRCRRVDAVLMDLQMPEMDGLECTQRIREMEADGSLPLQRCRRLPIVAVTASAGSEVERTCIAAGMDGCMFKPCSQAQMIAAVVTGLQSNRVIL